MIDEIVLPDDIETPDPIEPDVENDDELDPEADPLPPENETVEQKDARIAALEERNRKLYARVQRDKNKGKPAPVAPVVKTETAQPASLTREEGILFSKGFSEEEVEYAKKVATLEGVKITEAVSNKLFTGWKAERDADAKRQEAQLPASRGGKSPKKTTFDTPGLSDDDHKALFNEAAGK
jgi:hypothetical protein